MRCWPEIEPEPFADGRYTITEEDAAAHVAHLHLVRDVPSAMTAQFSNSNGGKAESGTTVAATTWLKFVSTAWNPFSIPIETAMIVTSAGGRTDFSPTERR